MKPEQAKQLRDPFPGELIGKLPRVTCKDCRDNKQAKVCSQHKKTKCAECGQYMTTAHMHLDYVGHAAVTDRLLRVDPDWTWEPMAQDPNGYPVFDNHGGLWIKLTVAGVTRPGYGDPGNTGPKEAIGDALRNAAMRFGVALDLWSKQELTDAPTDEPVSQRNTPQPDDASGEEHTAIERQLYYSAQGLRAVAGKEAADQFIADLLREKGYKKFAEVSPEDAEIIYQHMEAYRLQKAEGIPA